MRRGQTRIGGWRNENSRHFNSRNGGNSHYRSSRNYDLPDSQRFPPPSSRSRRPQQYNSRLDNQEHIQEHTDRYRYRNNRHHFPRQPHQSERHMLPVMHHSRHDDHHRNTFNEPTNFYEDVQTNHFHVNNMGDIDHRQFPQLNNFRPPLINPWGTDNNLLQNEKLFNKPYRQDSNDINKYSDYTGHRPPASDHYGCNATLSVSGIDNSHSFSRSVDDTVDIVRKRLLNRNEPQHHLDKNISTQNDATDENKKNELSENYQHNQEPPTRKKYNRQRRGENTNCAKIKNKIVHQLFKMDKEKIHKLMDNPNSSNKFEYAISSLITESQNSFNRHMRSVAEKSLTSTSTEFIENDNNTIYEDTFMKQMQCILDPQDTVFLEDIKPIVMAELCKVLQVDEFEQTHPGEEENIQETRNERQHYNAFSNNINELDDNLQHNGIYTAQSNVTLPDFTRSKSVEPSTEINDKYHNNQLGYKEPDYLSDRRSRRKSCSYYQGNIMPPENTYFGTEYNNVPEKMPYTSLEYNKDNVKVEDPQIPTFYNLNPQQCSEEEDPFAELDNQYHVAVDHDFIDDNISSPRRPQDGGVSDVNNVQREFQVKSQIPDKNLENLTDKSQFSLTDFININSDNFRQDNNFDTSDTDKNKKDNTEHEINDITKEADKKEEETPSNSRKRSIDQRPSHRKEKRRKDSCHSETGNQVLIKNEINVNNCNYNISDKCVFPKSIYNILFSKEDNKDQSCIENNERPVDNIASEICSKKKETPKKTPVKDNRARRKDSTSSNQSSSPQETSSSCQNNLKLDTKSALKTIDMFTEQPRKINVHQAHRNTAINPIPVHKTGIDSTIKTKETLCRQLTRKHIAVQVNRKLPCKETQTVIKKYNSRSIQTIRKKVAVKAVQTDDIVTEAPTTRSNDAFERMKEIDLEIQVLLQEKFKLYNSMESRDVSHNSMQTLGMTVLNVTPFEGDVENIISEDTLLSEDVIVNNFANIASEDLEQIAFESVQEIETPKTEKRNRRRKISYQSISSECSTTAGVKKKRPKSPNISLLEQIITDDRPLEDIISLDDLEVTPHSKKKLKKGKQNIKRKTLNKGKATKIDISNIEIKECSVLLIREDFSKYFNQQHIYTQDPNTLIEESSEELILVPSHETIPQPDLHIEETIVNDIQIDMLDVSEDITVGDNFEDKEEAVVNITMPINEEIILDNNSQSSLEDAAGPALNQDEECKMYDYSSDENLRRDSVIVSGNADAVLALECVETNFLAACLDGNVYYFNNDGQLLTTLRGSNLAVTCLTIVKDKYETTVYTGSLDSRIRYYDLETGLEKGPECNVLSPIQTMDRAWDTVFVGTRTGFVLQFECKNNMLIPVSSVKFSEQSILALRAMKEGPRKVLLVAARSENVTIKDAQTGLLLRTLVGPKMTVYTLLYEDGKVYCGTSSHQIHVFDYTSGGHAGTHEGGKGAVCLRATGGLLFAGCYDGCVYVYREGEARPFAQIRGPSLMLLSLAIVGTKIIAGYKDRSLYIWKIPLSILQEMIL